MTFSSADGAVIADIIAEGPGYATSSPRNVAYGNFVQPVQSTLVMSFATPASGVSFYAIDVGASSRDAIAYDLSNTVLEVITIYNPGTGAGVGNIDPVVFSAANIAYITFGQGAQYMPGDGAAIDDLEFTVPAPGGAGVLLLAAGRLVIPRRRA